MVLWVLASDSHGELLYDVTFSSPPNVVGQAPVLQTSGTQRIGPSANNFGASVVVTSFGGLIDQPLHLVPTQGNQFRYAQLKFGVSASDGFTNVYPYYHIGMDLYLNNFQGNNYFSMYLDNSGNLVRLDLNSNGTMTQGMASGTPQVGQFQFGAVFTLGVDIDLPSNMWTISLSGQPVYTGKFSYPTPAYPNPPTYLYACRINLADDPSTPQVPDAAVDNVRITGIPEPSPGILASLALLVFVFRKARMR
jgi:hypothetical protein